MGKIRSAVKTTLSHLSSAGLPKFIIVGAQKAGTTALHYYLNQHPLLVGSRPKEVGFFDNDENYSKGLAWYKKSFVNLKNPLKKVISFEATPEYLYRSYVPERLFNFNPHLKIIILLREPVKRSYSAWNMYRYFGQREQGLPGQFYQNYVRGKDNNIMNELYKVDAFPSFEEVVEKDINRLNQESDIHEPSFLRRSIYYPQIKRFYDRFPKENIKVIGFKDLIGEGKIDTLNGVLRFLDLKDSDWGFLKDEKRNSRVYTDVLEENTAKELANFFEPYNQQLFDFLGYKPNW